MSTMNGLPPLSRTCTYFYSIQIHADLIRFSVVFIICFVLAGWECLWECLVWYSASVPFFSLLFSIRPAQHIPFSCPVLSDRESGLKIAIYRFQPYIGSINGLTHSERTYMFLCARAEETVNRLAQITLVGHAHMAHVDRDMCTYILHIT